MMTAKKPSHAKKPATKAAKNPAAKKPTPKAAKPAAKPSNKGKKAPAKAAKAKPLAKKAPAKPASKTKSAAPKRPLVRPPLQRPSIKDKKADVYFNGRLVFQTAEPEKLAESIRKKRRMSLISSQVNVAYHPVYREIRVNTEHGRARRPLVIVENGKPRLTEQHLQKLTKSEIEWSYLVQHGIIEYLDAEEEENSMIAIDEEHVTKDHTHMELNPITILGTAASLIPYPEYNRGDRINYGAKMVGQAIGTPALNFSMRTDTKNNLLSYPQIEGQPPCCWDLSLTPSGRIVNIPPGRFICIWLISNTHQ